MKSKIVLAELQTSLCRYEKKQGEWLGHISEYYKLFSIKEISQFIDTHKENFKIVTVISIFFDNPPIDLSGFDLVIVINPELIREELSTHLELLRKHFSNNNVLTVTSEYLPTCLPHPSVYRYPFFLTETPLINDYIDTNDKEKLKSFDVLLGLNKKHRQFIFNSLRHHNLLDECYISLLSKNREKYVYYSDDLRSIETDDVLQAINKNNGIFYSQIATNFTQYQYPISRQVPYNIYKNSWYSIVAETNWQTWTFISEKTAKPLFSKRLFVIFAAPYYLKKLREWGFLTFDTIIDESYDLELNNQLRYKKAFDQVLLLRQLDPVTVYEKINPILEHNHNLIANREYFIAPLRNWLTRHIMC